MNIEHVCRQFAALLNADEVTRADVLMLADALEEHGGFHPNVLRYLRERVSEMYLGFFSIDGYELMVTAMPDAPRPAEFDIPTDAGDGSMFPVWHLRQLLLPYCEENE